MVEVEPGFHYPTPPPMIPRYEEDGVEWDMDPTPDTPTPAPAAPRARAPSPEPPDQDEYLDVDDLGDLGDLSDIGDLGDLGMDESSDSMEVTVQPPYLPPRVLPERVQPVAPPGENAMVPAPHQPPPAPAPAPVEVARPDPVPMLNLMGSVDDGSDSEGEGGDEGGDNVYDASLASDDSISPSPAHPVTPPPGRHRMRRRNFANSRRMRNAANAANMRQRAQFWVLPNDVKYVDASRYIDAFDQDSSSTDEYAIYDTYTELYGFEF